MSEDQRLVATKFKEYDGGLESGRSECARSESGAWWTFASAMMLVTVAGTVWSFSVFSHVFKDPHSGFVLSQTQLEMLGALSTGGNYFALDAGYITAKYGTEVTMIIGVSMVSLGYFALWICLAVVQSEVPFVVLVVCFFTYGHGCGLLDNAYITELITDFPAHRGSVVGCAKGLYGLSTGMLTLFGALLVDSDPTKFILMQSIYAGVVGVFAIPTIRHTKGIVSEQIGRISAKLFYVAFGIIFGAVSLCVFCIRLNDLDLALKNASTPVLVVSCACVAGGFSLLWLVVLPGDTSLAYSEEVAEVQKLRYTPVDMTLMDMFCSLNFWLFFLALTVGIGTGVMVMNSAAQILPAFGGVLASRHVQAFVAVCSCCSCLGRVGSGNISEWMKERVPRPYFLVGALFANAFLFTMIATIGKDTIWIAGPLIVFFWGCIWGLLPTLGHEFFGPTDYSMKYAIHVLSGCIGGFLFATFIAGTIFDDEAKKMDEYPSCYDPSCFELSFIIAAVSNLCVALVCMVLCARTTEIYSTSTKEN